MLCLIFGEVCSSLSNVFKIETSYHQIWEFFVYSVYKSFVVWFVDISSQTAAYLFIFLIVPFIGKIF